MYLIIKSGYLKVSLNFHDIFLTTWLALRT